MNPRKQTNAFVKLMRSKKTTIQDIVDFAKQNSPIIFQINLDDGMDDYEAAEQALLDKFENEVIEFDLNFSAF